MGWSLSSWLSRSRVAVSPVRSWELGTAWQMALPSASAKRRFLTFLVVSSSLVVSVVLIWCLGLAIARS